jgi:hypothetical protein
LFEDELLEGIVGVYFRNSVPDVLYLLVMSLFVQSRVSFRVQVQLFLDQLRLLICHLQLLLALETLVHSREWLRKVDLRVGALMTVRLPLERAQVLRTLS